MPLGQVARRLGLEIAPVHVAKSPTGTLARAYRFIYNGSSENAAWDDKLIGLDLGDVFEANFDPGLTSSCVSK